MLCQANSTCLRCCAVIAAVSAAAALLGCSEELTPRAHYEIPFSVYGVLSPQLDTQSVRVYAVEDFPTLASPEPLDVVVTSTDMITDEQRIWAQTVLREPNGQYEYLFKAPFRAAYGHRYRIEVRRSSDSAVSFAEVRVPPPVQVRLVGPDSLTLQVRLEGKGIRALKPEVEYVLQAAGAAAAPILSYKVSYQTKERQVTGGWQININLGSDRYQLQSLYNHDAPAFTGTICHAIALRNLKLHVLVGDSAWNPPGGVFDPDILSEPGTLQNVQNGFGFIGGGYRIDVPLRPSRQAVEEACFFYDFIF